MLEITGFSVNAGLVIAIGVVGTLAGGFTDLISYCDDVSKETQAMMRRYGGRTFLVSIILLAWCVLSSFKPADEITAEAIPVTAVHNSDGSVVHVYMQEGELHNYNREFSRSPASGETVEKVTTECTSLGLRWGVRTFYRINNGAQPRGNK